MVSIICDYHLAMTYDQLLAFTTVASAGSFTAASARLHKSQPAVSKLVRKLEDTLGIELFDRGAYRATLSPAGRLFFERATLVLHNTAALESFGRSLADEPEPSLRLAIDAITPLAPLMAALRQLEQAYPTLRIELETERMTGAVDALRDERVDVAVALLLDGRPQDLEVAAFTPIEIVFVVRVDHPLAQAPAPVSSALLRAHAQVVLRDSSRSVGPTSVNVLAGGLRWAVTDVQAKREIILAGMGWGGLPRHLVAEALGAGRLVSLDVEDVQCERLTLHLLRRRGHPHGVAAQALWDQLARHGGPSAGRLVPKK